MPVVFIALPIIGIAIFIYVVFLVRNEYRRCRIEYEQARLLGLVVRYPNLSDDSFYDEKGGHKKVEKYEFARYNAYCFRVFNLLQDLFYYGDGDEEKMRQMLDFDEYIIRHKKWWIDVVPRLSCYRMRFVIFINRLVSRFDSEKELRKAPEDIF